MLEEFSEIYFYLKGTLKYKRTAMSIALIFCCVGWLSVYFMSDKFESKAKVHIDTENMLRPLMKGMVIDPDVSSMIRIIQQLMFTRPNLEKIVQISLLNKSINQATDKIEFFEKLQKSITIRSSGSRDIYDISYSSNDPDVAKSVVQAVLTVFSENTQGKAMSDSSDAHNFIEQQIRDYEIRLQEAEKNKEEFKSANMDLLAETDQLHAIQTINKELQDALVILQQLQAKKDVLSEQLRQVASGNDQDAEGAINATDQPIAEDPKIRALKDKKNDLLLKYTDKHPQIAGIDELIQDLENQNVFRSSEKIDDRHPNRISPEKIANPYVQSLKTSFDNVVADVASQQVLVDSIKERLNTIQQGMKDRFSLETEMKNLNRDYETISKQYFSLLERREQAHITEEIDDQTSRLKFKIADPPTKSLKPAFPNRILFYSGILVVGIGVGFGVAFLLYFFKPVFMSVSQVKIVTGLPILGNVSIVSNDEKSPQGKDWLFVALILILLSFYTAMMTIELIKS
jgi:polysaccharide chain length determinant protein (PEP-CTERM system associated)